MAEAEQEGLFGNSLHFDCINDYFALKLAKLFSCISASVDGS